jgi:hypothetical protein
MICKYCSLSKEIENLYDKQFGAYPMFVRSWLVGEIKKLEKQIEIRDLALHLLQPYCSIFTGEAATKEINKNDNNLNN